MSNLFGLNKPNTNLKKNVFDLSEKTLFSMSPGMLVPVTTREVNPGEKIKISMSAFTRTQPLNTAAFVRARQYYHFFFVPFRQLWSGWDNFINGVNYKTSSYQVGQVTDKVPTVALFKALSKIAKRGRLVPADFNEFRPLTYDRDRDRFTKGILDILDEHGVPYLFGISRLLDMLGYGLSYYDDRRYRESSNTVYNSRMLETWNPAIRSRSLTDLFKSLLRNGLDASIVNFTSGTAMDWRFTDEDMRRFVEVLDGATQRVNIFRLLAYQKIYSDFYKRDDYEATRPEHFNIDDLQDVNSASVDRLLNMFRIRYRWMPKDYFTGVVPSELFGVERVLDNLISRETSGVKPGSGISSDGHKVSIDTGIAGINSSAVNTKSIRAVFALEKLLRLTRRAGGHDYISQTMAHYGFEPPKGRGDKVEFLGGVTNTINISEVLTQANTSEGTTGQVYGKGIGSVDGNNDIEFTAKEHGLIMCIASIVPELDYSCEGLNAFNTKFRRGDYFHPELQDLGLQPVFNYELNNWFSSKYEAPSEGISYLSLGDVVTNDGILGYVPRYSEYKTAYDTLHGEFRRGRSLSAWSAVAPVMTSRNGILLSSLKISPHSLNSIFSIEFDGREETDQFMCQVQFIIKAIRPMSVTGQNL